MVLGDEASGRWLGHESGVPNGISSLIKEALHHVSTARRRLSMNQEADSQPAYMTVHTNLCCL